MQQIHCQRVDAFVIKDLIWREQEPKRQKATQRLIRAIVLQESHCRRHCCKRFQVGQEHWVLRDGSFEGIEPRRRGRQQAPMKGLGRCLGFHRVTRHPEV